MTKRCAVQEISEFLESLPKGGIMEEIADPVEWQRQQRDEWGNWFGTILNYTNRLELSILFSKKYVSLQTRLRSRRRLFRWHLPNLDNEQAHPRACFLIMSKDTLHTLPPTKIAVLIDGGFFLKRFNALYNKDRCLSAEEIADCMHSMALHMVGNNTLYRIFYYDCMPLGKKFHNPITHKSVD